MIHHNGKSTAPPMAVARNMSQLAHDVVELVELQSSLIHLELQGWWKQLVLPAVLMVVGGVMALSCVPILIVSGAYGLAAATQLGMGWSLLISAAVAMLLAAIIGWIGLRRLKAAQAPLRESRRELSQNVRWIKSVLQNRAKPSTALRSTHQVN